MVLEATCCWFTRRGKAVALGRVPTVAKRRQLTDLPQKTSSKALALLTDGTLVTGLQTAVVSSVPPALPQFRRMS